MIGSMTRAGGDGAAATGRARRARMRAGTVLAALAPAVLLAGCAGGGAPPSPTPDAAPATSTAPPAPPTGEELVRAVALDRLDAMTVEQRIASMLMVHVPGTDGAAIGRAAADWGVGGLILMGDNVAGSEADVAAMLAAAQPDPGLPLLTGIDEEGGIVTRLPGDVWPAGAELAAAGPDATRAAFASRGKLVASAGVAINFGVVADVTDDPASFIYDRVLGFTPEQAAANVTAAVQGEASSVMTTLKHFPGHGAVAGDTHVSIPHTPMGLDEWRATDALPFVAGIDAGAELVMTTHVVYDAVDAVPASLSATWQSELRDSLGFDGVIVSDDMLMLQHSGVPEYADPVANAVAAVGAGTDLLLYVLPADPNELGADPRALTAGIAAAVADGRIAQDEVDDSALRLLELRLGLVDPGALASQCDDECAARVR